MAGHHEERQYDRQQSFPKDTVSAQLTAGWPGTRSLALEVGRREGGVTSSIFCFTSFAIAARRCVDLKAY